ncbi:hypothetical protein EC991_005245 [Linnemannia zychae]|nr:hypothetical protein EC991_005245 [Linnemannia zychae]
MYNTGYQQWAIPRPKLYEIVRRLVPDHRIHFGCRVLNITEAGERITISLSNGDTFDGDIIVGADGAYSVVRQRMYGLLKAKGELPKADHEDLPFSCTCLVGQTKVLDPVQFPIVDFPDCHFTTVHGKDKPFTWHVFNTSQNTLCWMTVRHLNSKPTRTTMEQRFRDSDSSEWGDNAAQIMCDETRDFPINIGGSKTASMGDLYDLTPKEYISKVMLEDKVFKTWYHRRYVLLGDGAVTAMHDALALANLLYAMPTRTIEEVTAIFEEYHKERYPNVIEAYDNSITLSKMFNTGVVTTLLLSFISHIPLWVFRLALSKSMRFRPQCGFLPIVGQKGTTAAELSSSQQKARSCIHAMAALPTECLHLVIRHLLDQSDSNTLATLLRASKYICSVALPIMYEDPFRLVRFQTLFDSVPEYSKTIARVQKLIRVLLHSLPKGQVIADILRVAYLQESTGQESTSQESDTLTAAQSTYLPYYTFVTNVTFEYHSVREGQIFWNQELSHRPSFATYLEKYGMTNRYICEEIPLILRYQQEHILVSKAAARELRSELIWTLCEANAERVKHVAIPIMDISRYVSSTCRFKILSSVTFLLDKGLKPHSRLRPNYSPDEKEELQQQKSSRILAMEGMITFTQEHCRLFPNVLMVARCHKDSYASNDDCPRELQFRLLQSLPPLIKPTSLNHKNWIQFAAKPQETDLSLVKSIAPFPPMSRHNKIPAVIGTPFLHRCRILESIEMPSLDDDSFEWAVAERKQHDMDMETGRIPQRPLVPLQNFNITYREPAFGRQINDVAFAFGKTLKEIFVSGDWSPLNDAEVERAFSIGVDVGAHSWDVPQLTKFAIVMNSILIRIHPDIISQSPRLTRIFMRDPGKEYRLNEVVYWTPAELLELCDLYLVGTPAISFHPDTLRSTANLERMEINTHTTRAASLYTPPSEDFDSEAGGAGGDGESDNGINGNLWADESHSAASGTLSILKKRPTWTWDWNLPKLVDLKLEGEIAYKFKFKFLDKVPNLLYFWVDTTSWSRQHERTVEIMDLLKPGYQHPELAHFFEKEKQRSRVIDSVDGGNTDDTKLEDELAWKEFEYVHVPGMKRFTLTGQWSLESRVLEILFGKYFGMGGVNKAPASAPGRHR